MNRNALIGALVVLVFLLLGCSPSGPATPAQAPTDSRPAVPVSTQPATAVSAAIASPAAAEATGVPVTGAATVQVRNVGDFGPVLVDREGRSLYLYTGGVQFHAPTPCAGEECLEVWLPLLADGEPVPGPGVDPTLLGTIPRDDGTIQVTYDGWRLYYLNQDKQPDDAMGQGDDHEWYLVSPSGKPVRSVERE